MFAFIAKRVLSAILTLFIICTLTFFMMNMIPGGPFLSERTSDKIIAITNEKYGLDKPLIVQYKNYMLRLLQGDMGDSYKRKGFTVAEIISEKFPVSASLGLTAMAASVLIGVTMGCAAAVRRNKLTDRTIMFVCTLGVAVPSFVIGTLLKYVFGVWLKWLPTLGLKSGLHYILPAFALSLQPMSYIARLLRSNMLDVIDQDYIKTARAKGLSKNAVIYKHALKNSILPIVTYLGPMTAYILVGGAVTESIFSIPGLGKYFVETVLNRDYTMIMGTTIFLGLLIIGANCVVDILYRFIDPRISLG